MDVEQAEAPIPDHELVARIAAGDSHAFAVLFRRRRLDVFRFALHMTASPSVAEDVTQDVFLEVMREAGRYDSGRAPVAAWLCGIARNFVRRRLDSDRRLEPLDDGDPRAEQRVLDVGIDPLAGLTLAEQLEGLRRAVLTLPLPYREAVVLCDLQEMSYLDAAEALGCAVGTVRSRLHRGRALLASKLGAERRALRQDTKAGTRCFA